MKIKLEAVTNLTLLAVTLIVAAMISYKQFFISRPDLGRQFIGQSIDTKTFGPTVGDQAIVILLSTDCKYCALSTPFYRQIATRSSGRNITAAFLQSEEEGKQYLLDKKVDIRNVVGSTTLIQRIPTTPAIVIVDKSGKIVNAWIGKLPPEKEKEVLDKLPL